MNEALASESEKKVLLSENLRQQYLQSMGIQTWFDPLLVMPEAEINSLSGKKSPNENISTDNVTVETRPQENTSELSVLSVKELPGNEVDNSLNDSLESLSIKISQCELCELHINRQQAISGEGNSEASIFIIIDAPISDSVSEHALLNVANKKMLQAMLQTIGYQISSIFITSLVKCRPAENQQPQTSEMICCDDHLSAQIKTIEPDVIIVLGECASQQLLVSQKSLTDLRLRDHKHFGIPVYASYHPEALFNSSETKRKVWADLLQIKQHLK